MLAPQFSLKRLLAWVTLSAFVCLIVAAAANGQMVAAAVLVALAGLVIMLAVHGLLYGLVKFLSLLRDGRRRRVTNKARRLATEA